MMPLPAFIKKINHSPAWHMAKQKQYQWLYVDIEKNNSTKNKQSSASPDYQIGLLSHLETPPKIKDIWHLSTQLGDLYLINASDYLQAQTGIYPYHQEIHTQEWLILCIEKEIKKHWPQLQIKHLELLEQAPKKMQVWQLQLAHDYLYLAAPENTWYKILKNLHALPRPHLVTQNIPLHLPVLLGQTELSKKQYKNLRPHDIIYLDRTYFNHKGEGFCAVGDWQIELYYQNQHFYFKEWNATSMSKLENPYDEIFEDDEDENESDERNDDDFKDELDAYDESDESDDLDNSNDLNDSDDSDSDEMYDDLDLDEDEDAKPIKLKADRLNTGASSHKNIDEDLDTDEIDHSSDEGEQPQIMPPFKNIPVLLNFSLGQLKMTLTELSELSEGALLPLASNDAAITIYANHLPVARGEVVMIDERLAVQITEILEK